MTDSQTPPASGRRSAAAGQNPGVIATGDRARIDQRNLVLPADALRAAVSDEAVARLNNLPTPDSQVFKGRDDALDFLDALPSTGTGIVAQSVRGMGGIGKSTLVLHHARSHLNAERGPVWWIDASSAAAITTDLAALATALNPVHAALPLDEAAKWALAWLQGHTGWLLVLDNAEEPADLRPYLGRLSTGQVLVTTRRDLAWQDLGASLRLDTLTPAASLAVLQEITGRHTDIAALDSLADELGYLPLALQQAGAYLAQTRSSTETYLSELRADPAGVLAATPPGDPQQRTIAQLWSVTLSTLHTTNPHAVQLLRILACYAPDPLPRHILTTSLHTPRAVDHALGILAAYSMITLTDTTVTLHRLVQTVVRTATPAAIPQPQRKGLRRLLHRSQPTAPPHPSRTALALVHAAMPPGSPGDVSTWPAWQNLLPHIQATSTHQQSTRDTTELASLLRRTAFYLWARGQAAQALPLEERALQLTETALGPNHPDTVTCLGNLAETLSALGRHTDALPLKERALQVAETALGPNHPTTATCLGNLAATYSALGRHADALPLKERALRTTETALGPNHPDTATCLGNLAETLSALGRHTDALPLKERALQVAETALGPNHPDTATCLNNLASTYNALGRHTDALPLQKQALDITETALGPDHPDTATCLNNLAATYSALGRHTDALPLKERALQVAETALGPDHPDTATCLNNLASTYNALGRHTDALPLQKQALHITETTLGPDHPTTAMCLNNLAETLSALGRHTDALPLKERALRTTETALGPNHPDTATCLNNLASTYSDLGRHTDALPLQKQALHITETTLGPNHPTTALRLGNLASIYSDLGRHTDALPLQERALRITETALGPDHPDTALRLGNLASTYSDLGRHTDALPLQERALQITETTLGPDHPTTALRLGNLANIREVLTSSEGELSP
ncbi:FxSxx-COOH system tetratricopeptide repeat protein [Streptomyces sp. NBC_01381]|uniref:FxSxx-COOH system tetratricopeptide repeat protein n=1 Tax=Streptomyces sp. NBC_01381 TaxID=2903845 RepID=UPI00225755C3|nr:FxSxx-COOH system tetratricopeptide repeat protein [Streptomyces sp. NBC_01381]MCX4667986.1 FxSxx-COOH system tetratricopeptide repeat protein [Streptomyces sp. NBC_01381]